MLHWLGWLWRRGNRVGRFAKTMTGGDASPSAPPSTSAPAPAPTGPRSPAGRTAPAAPTGPSNSSPTGTASGDVS